MGKEGWAVGEKLRKVWRKHKSLQDFVSFQCMGYGTNMQWVYCVQTEEDAAKPAEVPQYFNGLITGVNLEMMERPELLEPPIVAGKWEETTVTCFLNPNKTERKVGIMSLAAFARHVQVVQRVLYEFWEILRGVIRAGTDGFVYNPPHVRTPANRKVTHSRGGKSPRPQRSLAESVAKAEEDHKQASGQEPVAATSARKRRRQRLGRGGKRRSSMWKLTLNLPSHC